MEWYWWLALALWTAGWLREAATLDCLVQKHSNGYPEGFRPILWAVLYFIWPYFYFYRKA